MLSDPLICSIAKKPRNPQDPFSALTGSKLVESAPMTSALFLAASALLLLCWSRVGDIGCCVCCGDWLLTSSKWWRSLLVGDIAPETANCRSWMGGSSVYLLYVAFPGDLTLLELFRPWILCLVTGLLLTSSFPNPILLLLCRWLSDSRFRVAWLSTLSRLPGGDSFLGDRLARRGGLGRLGCSSSKEM